MANFNPQLPCNVEAERALLALIMADGNRMDLIHDVISPNDFYVPNNQLVATAIWKLYSQDKLPDIVLIADSMGEKLESIGGISVLAQYQAEQPSSIEYYARLIANAASRRNIILNCHNAIEKAKLGEKEPDEIIDETIKSIQNCSVATDKDVVHVRTVISNYMKLARRRMEAGDLSGIGVSTGLTSLDSALSAGGISIGTLPTVIAGQPGDGKSALAANIAHSAAKAGGTVLYCTFEDLAQSPTVRIFSRISGVSNKQLQNAIVDFRDFGKIEKAISEVWDCNIFFMEKIPKSPEYLVGAIKRFAKIHKPVLVIIDYLQILRGKGKDAQERVDDVFSNIVVLSRQLEDAAVVLLSQYRRKDRQVKPQNSDLYHSGSIEQGSASIIHIWDPKLPIGFPLKTIVIGKQKNGPRDLIAPVGWNADTASFENLPDEFYGEIVERYWSEECFYRINTQVNAFGRYATEMQKLRGKANDRK